MPSAKSALQRSIRQGSPKPPAGTPSAFSKVEFTPLAMALLALVLVAIAFGGGGVRYGMANLIVQLTALGILAIYKDAFFSFWRSAPFTLSLLIGASLALPILQLVPLPETVWTALPGRTLAADARTAVGAMGWAPASLDSARTMVALSGLIAPLTLLAVGWSARKEQILILGWLVVALGLVNVLVGASQALSTEAVTSFYPENPMPGVLFGTFANRNSTGVFLVACLTFAALLPSPRAHPLITPARIAVCVLLVLAIVLTRSRTSLALTAIPLLLAAIRYALERLKLEDGKLGSGKAGLIIGAGGIIAIAALASLVSFAPGRIGDTLDRFDQDSNARQYIWEDALYASDRYWPAGSGMGTFDEVFQADESLEFMTQRRAGRAHNDYLEVAIEAGLPGVVLIAAWLVMLAWLAWRAKASPERWIAWSGAAILLAVALQSITDYPLRNQSMLVVSSLALLILVRFGAKETAEVGGDA